METLINADCLVAMKDIPDGSIDMVLTDPPYGTTACKWDSIIPFEPMWEQLKRVTKPNGAIVMTASQPFTSALIMSNVKMFKYCWVWAKSKCGSPFSAKYRPLAKHEDIVVFEKKGRRVNYYPQMTKGKPYSRKKTLTKNNNMGFGVTSVETDNKGTRHPTTVLDFPQKWRRQDQIHPTQKPVPLMEYLIKTYTSEGDTVLDFTMGSGTTGVACKNLNRNFIGIELDADYFKIASERITTKK
tara:strand:- start:2372 stop:3097 length:726 start_codon:yes stop_codon:yes gene_type:complete